MVVKEAKRRMSSKKTFLAKVRYGNGERWAFFSCKSKEEVFENANVVYVYDADEIAKKFGIDEIKKIVNESSFYDKVDIESYPKVILDKIGYRKA